MAIQTSDARSGVRGRRPLGARPARLLPHAARRRARRRRRQLRPQGRRAARPGRRVRLRQDHDRAGADAADPAARADRGRRRSLVDGTDLLAAARGADAAAPPGRHRDGRPGRDELAQPGDPRARPDRGRAPRSRRPALEGRARRADRRPACSGSAWPARRRHVPARAERRHEAARLHRHRDQPAAEGHHRRRADQRPRRRRPAPGDGDAAERPGRAGRRGDPGRPRHGADGPGRRPARRDVRRHAGRAVRRPSDLRGAAPPVQPAADRQPAVAGQEGRLPGHPRAAAVAARQAEGLPVPSALPQGVRHAAWTWSRS